MCTVFALIYGTAKDNCIGDSSALISLKIVSLRVRTKLRAVSHMAKAVEQLLKKARWIDL